MTAADLNPDDFAMQRERMVATHIAGRGLTDPRLLAAFRAVPRHLFCEPPGHPESYADHPLPIGEGQTISQPYIVALMTDELRLRGGERVLEIGTGSGYQTAILCEMAGEVVSVERHASLAERARRLLDRQGYANVSLHVGDGTRGWPEGAAYGAILVTAAAPHVPKALRDQLANGGRLVAPVGDSYAQTLLAVTREGDVFRTERGIACRFVKLIGEDGW
jgi:protein-L-isoaspartate(D-aspartate) O-methyltransferase